ncbi:MAG: hypothetical protein K2P31_03230, partial [Rickettsiaceae bacterium]|nr:hypothetical protein [Rickettsiaceae bacterium]
MAQQQLSTAQHNARSYASAVSTSAAHPTSVSPMLGMERPSSQAIENNRALYFSRHAATRQLQRGITNQAIETTLGSGLSFTSDYSTTSISGITKVVRGRNGNIITVIENTDITKHDVTRNTRYREQFLLKEIEKDNDHAMCERADLYASGDLGGKDIQKSHSLFIRAARLQNSHA